MELVSPRPAVTAEFAVSLPYDLFTTLILLDGPYKGISDWVVSTRALLPAELAERIHVLAGVLRYASALWGRLAALPLDDPARRDFAPFVQHLRGIDAGEFRELALVSVGQRLLRWDLEPDAARRTPEALGRSRRRLVGYLDALKAARRVRRPGSIEVEPDSGVLAGYLLDGDALKKQLVATLEMLWTGFCRERFEADLPRLEASVAGQRRQSHPADFAELLMAVTGRAVPEVMTRQMDGVECIEFVPNLHIGPYLVFSPAPPRMLVAYNALARAPFPEPPFERYPVAHRLLPVLDALADETRLSVLELLRAREMYAQEIAQAVGLSQSAISRHLRQLEEAGLVRVRRAGTMKHYSLDSACGQGVLASLKELMGVL